MSEQQQQQQTTVIAAADTPVHVLFGDRHIGDGVAEVTPSQIRVTGHYEWPPDAPAVVRFAFSFRILGEDTGELAVDWPGLSRPIPPTLASYFMALLLGRPDFMITTRDGDHATIAFVGPMGHPEITTGMQVTVTDAGATAGASLLFRFDRALGGSGS